MTRATGFEPNVRSARPQHDRLLDTSQWKNRTSPTLRAHNPICQLIVDGVRCKQAGREVHHIDADPAKFFDPDNLVNLCRECHYKLQGDDPANPRHYAPTLWLFGATYDHPEPPPKLKQGEVRIGPNGVAVIG
jgi:hypothetical protein